MSASTIDDREVARFVDAVTLGVLADLIFRDCCHEAGIDPTTVAGSPLEIVALASVNGPKQ